MSIVYRKIVMNLYKGPINFFICMLFRRFISINKFIHAHSTLVEEEPYTYWAHVYNSCVLYMLYIKCKQTCESDMPGDNCSVYGCGTNRVLQRD